MAKALDQIKSLISKATGRDGGIKDFASESQLRFLGDLQKFVEGNAVRPEEFAKVIKILADVIKDFQRAVKGNLSESDKLTASQISKVATALEESSAIGGENLTMSEERGVKGLNSAVEGLKRDIQAVSDAIHDPFDSSSLASRIEEVSGSIPTPQDTSEMERDIEVLEEDIDRLEDEIKELKKVKKTTTSGGFGIRKVWTPMVDRFADDTDGATKTFRLSKQPAATDTITVSGSDFPFELDPTVDFTVAGKLLTLTSAVDSPSAGSTLVVKYFV